MRLAVVDARLLIRAFEFPSSDPARLLALFAYGRVCRNVVGHPLDEADEMVREARQAGAALSAAELEGMRTWAERRVEEARRRKNRMETAFEQFPPWDLLLALSEPLLDELAQLAQASQGGGNVHVRPDVVLRLSARYSWTVRWDLGPAPFYLGEGRISQYEYLIHTAVTADAGFLISDDPELQLPGDASYRDERSGRTVRPFTLEDFVRMELPYNFDFRGFDVHAVLDAAVEPL
jgi:hypothetical protein